ncbi:MAG: hypothetical protein R6V45_00330 [Oceanipulchritudo sp.]
MPVHLIFLFLFQSGLAFAFSYFIARIVLGGVDKEAPEGIKRGIRIIRRIACGACLILPPLMFLAYFQSLPEGQPAALAVWPAAWILMILAAVVLALTIALHQASKGDAP